MTDAWQIIVLIWLYCLVTGVAATYATLHFNSRIERLEKLHLNNDDFADWELCAA